MAEPEEVPESVALAGLRRRRQFLISSLLWAAAAALAVFVSGYLLIVYHYALALAEIVRASWGLHAPSSGPDGFLLGVLAAGPAAFLAAILIGFVLYRRLWDRRLRDVWPDPGDRRKYRRWVAPARKPPNRPGLGEPPISRSCAAVPLNRARRADPSVCSEVTEMRRTCVLSRRPWTAWSGCACLVEQLWLGRLLQNPAPAFVLGFGTRNSGTDQPVIGSQRRDLELQIAFLLPQIDRPIPKRTNLVLQARDSRPQPRRLHLDSI